MSAMIPQIQVLKPCADAVEWLTSQPDPETAWAVCERADWMLWLAARLDIDRPTLVRAACDCARTTLKYVPTGEDRPRLVIEAAERWADDPSEENHKAVRDAADYADYVAHADAHAACAAVYAAAYDVAFAATYDADYAPCAAACAARAAARGASGFTALKAMTKLVRARIPWAMVAEKLED